MVTRTTRTKNSTELLRRGGWIAGLSLVCTLGPGCRSSTSSPPPSAPAASSGPAGAEYSRLPQGELERRAAGETDARAWRELGYRAAQSGDDQAALRHLDAALKLEPSSSDTHNIRAMVLVSLGRGAEAVREFQTAASLGPTRVGPRLNLGRYYLSIEQYSAAAQAFEEATRVDPKSAEAARLAGDAWRLIGSSVAAKRHYRNAVQLKPDEARSHAGLGEVLVNTGRFEEARMELKRARELGDAAARTRGYLGLAHAMGAAGPAEAKEALEHLEAARSAGETGSHVYYGFGLAYLAARDYAPAEKLLQEGLGRYPDVAGLYYTLAEVYAATGRAGDSRRLRERSAELTVVRETEQQFIDRISSQPQDLGRYLTYVDWLLGRKEADRALPLLQQARLLAPEDAGVKQRLARAEALARALKGPGGKQQRGSR